MVGRDLRSGKLRGSTARSAALEAHRPTVLVNQLLEGEGCLGNAFHLMGK